MWAGPLKAIGENFLASSVGICRQSLAVLDL